MDIQLASAIGHRHATDVGEEQQREADLDADRVADVLPLKPPSREVEQVDIHKPKPVHSWREFIGEIGIIVIGVLIALGGEQAVEAMHWRERVAGAEESMRKELAEDDGAQAMARIRFAPCLDRALAINEQRLLAERDHGVPFAAFPALPPPFHTWDNDAWRAAVSSQATSHMATEVMYNWSSPYALIGDMDQAAVREFNDWAPLIELADTKPHPSELERDRMISALAATRRDNALLTSLSGTLIRYAGITGVRPSETQTRQQVREALLVMPQCRRPDRDGIR